MAKMGYVHGSGLGKEGEGRIEPVEAMVFPPGRSLGKGIFFFSLFRDSGKLIRYTRSYFCPLKIVAWS